MASIIISVVALVLAVAALAYSVKVALVYHRFNEQIKDWAYRLDESAKDAINRSSREILRELDSKLTERETNNEEKIIEDVEE